MTFDEWYDSEFGTDDWKDRREECRQAWDLMAGVMPAETVAEAFSAIASATRDQYGD